MSFEDMVVDLNAACLDSCGGQSFAYERVVSATIGETGTFTGIPDTGAQAEASSPGDGTTYLRIWGAADLITLALEKGDEISTDTAVYKIVDMDEDAGSGLWLLLRKDSDIT